MMKNQQDIQEFPTPRWWLRFWLRILHRGSYLVCHHSPLRIAGFLDRSFTAWARRLFPGRLLHGNSSVVFSCMIRINQFLLPRLCGSLNCPTVYGFDLSIDQRSGRHYYLMGWYEVGTLDLIDWVLRDGDCFVDVGASVGQMSLFAAKRVGDTGLVLAFEPAPYRFEQLKNSIASSVLGRRVRAFEMALAAENGQAILDVNRFSPSMEGEIADADACQIATHRLDGLLATEALPAPVLLKIDVEGAEHIVLQGADSLLCSDSPPVVCFEYGVQGSSMPVVELLLSCCADYQFYVFSNGQFTHGRLQAVVAWDTVESGQNVVACTPAHVERFTGLQFALRS